MKWTMDENNNGRQNMLGRDAQGGPQVVSRGTYGFGEEGELAIFVNINFILNLWNPIFKNHLKVKLLLSDGVED